MNRERKYRVWDNGYNKMYYPTTNLFIDWDKYYGSKLQCEIADSNGNMACTDNPDEYVIMDYVGFKDKHDQEIYEDDIVKFHYFFASLGDGLGVGESEHELIGRVVWREFGWGISSISGQHWEGYTGYKSGQGESYVVDLFIMNESSIHEESFEKIGNIHQHPELLNQTA